MIPSVTSHQMSARIYEREDNIYSRPVITNVLSMYMDECRKALVKGECVLLPRVGTIIPEVKVASKKYNLPPCNKEEENPPYTRVRITRNSRLKGDMDGALIRNISKGIMGLDELPFDSQQIMKLKESGFIPSDFVIENEEEED